MKNTAQPIRAGIWSESVANLQTLVSLPFVFAKTQKKRIRSNEKLVAEAAWSADGKRVFIMNGDKTAISVWEALD